MFYVVVVVGVSWVVVVGVSRVVVVVGVSWVVVVGVSVVVVVVGFSGVVPYSKMIYFQTNIFVHTKTYS